MTTPTSPAAALLAAQQAAFRNEGPVPASVRKQRLQSVIDQQFSI